VLALVLLQQLLADEDSGNLFDLFSCNANVNEVGYLLEAAFVGKLLAVF